MDQELLLRNEYLAADNRILKAQLQGRLRLSDAERMTLAEIGHRLGRKALGEVATAALPGTILGWYRRLVARKFDGSCARRTQGRPPIGKEIEGTDRSGWPRKIDPGAMTGLSGHSPIWDIISPIKRSAMFCGAMVYRQRRSADERSHGQNSFGLTSRCWW